MPCEVEFQQDTIVYGLFALITLGPFLRDRGSAFGLNISATSVLTAGLIMGDQQAQIAQLLERAAKAHSRFDEAKPFWK